MVAPKMVAADTPDRGRMHYLVDADLDFVPEVKQFLDWKAGTRRAPATVEAYCYRLWWFYRFLAQRRLPVTGVQPADLTEFVIWLGNPYRDADTGAVGQAPRPLGARTVNLILQAVSTFCHFLVRRGTLAASPVTFVDVPRGRWLTERDLLAHTRRGASTVRRMALRVQEPRQHPKTVTPAQFAAFTAGIRVDGRPDGDPSGFRDHLLCLMLKEGGFRIGELLGLRLEDLDFGGQGAHVRFRPDNENGARAKAGYGRDRFVHLPPDVLGLLDVYLTEVWIAAAPRTDHLWLVLKRDARDRTGRATCGTALTRAAVEAMFRHYTHKSGIHLRPHMLRHTHVLDLIRAAARAGQPVTGSSSRSGSGMPAW
jgi:integrase/recombinase XerD